MISTGHRYGLICVSVTKRALQSDMPAAMRLEFLGHLETAVDATLTTEIVAMIEPMDDDGWELYLEAAKLGYGPRSPCLFTVLDRKFELFAALNPTLQAAHDRASRNPS